jgi:phenolic acid decarboxylase
LPILLEEIIWYQVEDPPTLEYILLHYLYQAASQEQQDYYLDNKEDEEYELHDTVIAGQGVSESLIYDIGEFVYQTMEVDFLGLEVSLHRIC